MVGRAVFLLHRNSIHSRWVGIAAKIGTAVGRVAFRLCFVRPGLRAPGPLL